jgi:glycosyltransferase involved in cell wall biosynthesis
LAKILRREKIDLVHCIALRSILLGALAASLAGVHSRVLAITGGGFMSADKSALTKVPAHIVRFFIGKVITNSRTHFVFENVTDPLDYGLQPTASNVTILGGAGVDPEYFMPSPLAQGSALRIAMVSRMLWSKGADTAVEAVELARASGCDVRLSLYGAPDPSNPRAISIETLKEWASRDGIEWTGPIKDVRQVWKTHHVACLPSRGGEGLPRTILEAAACGRCLLVTDVPGCRDFVRNGQEGWLVPVGDAQQLAELIRALFGDREQVRAAGQKARDRVLAGFTEDHVVEKIKALYATLRR